MNKALTKYKIGLGVILVFTLAVVVYLLVQATNTKHDNKLSAEANRIAYRLNTYTNNGSDAPWSLSEIGIQGYPGITYQDIDAYRYSFCINYKTTSDNFSATEEEEQLLTSSYGGDTQKNSNNYYEDGVQDLYISPSHHKGNNCQTVNLSHNQAIDAERDY